MKYVVAIIICAGLLLIGFSFYRTSRGPSTPADYTEIIKELHRVRMADYEILKSGKGSEEEIAKSLRRYSAQNLSGSEVYVKHYLNDTRPVVYSAALEASGAFEWASLADFQAALQSKDVRVQRAALVGLSKRHDEDRVKTIQAYLQYAHDPDAKFEALLALHNMLSDAKAKADLEAQMISLSDNVSGASQAKLLIRLLGLSVRSPRLVQQARGWLRSTKSDELAGKALQYIFFHDRAWVSENLSQLPVREHPFYQNVALDIVETVCVKEWASLEIALRQKATSPEVKARLESFNLPSRCRN